MNPATHHPACLTAMLGTDDCNCGEAERRLREKFGPVRPTSSRDLTYRVFWSAPDGEWVATCDQYPGLSWLAASPAYALSGLVHLAVEALVEEGGHV